MPEPGREEPISTVVKATSLLELLAETGESNVAGLSEALGEPRTNVYRLVRTLVKTGYVEASDGRGTYRLGLKLFHLGGAVVARFDERQAALPHMEKLHEQTGETVFLCVRRDWRAVCIERIEGSRAVSLALRLGGSLPLHAGAAPRALLAYEPRSVWSAYCDEAGVMERFTPSTPRTRRELFELLEQVRGCGYSVSDEDVTLGIAAVGAAVRNRRGAVTAAISISGVRPAILGDATHELATAVVAAADAVSSSLGFPGTATSVLDE